MNEKYKIIKDKDFTTIYCDAITCTDEIKKVIDSAAFFDQTGRTLWIIEQNIELPIEELQQIAKHAKEQFSPPAKAALVVSHKITYAFASILAEFIKEEHYDISTFRTQDKAMSWLMKSAES